MSNFIILKNPQIQNKNPRHLFLLQRTMKNEDLKSNDKSHFFTSNWRINIEEGLDTAKISRMYLTFFPTLM